MRRIYTSIICPESRSNSGLIVHFLALFELLLVCTGSLSSATRRQGSLLRQKVIVVAAGDRAHFLVCLIMNHRLIATRGTVPQRMLSCLLQFLVDSDLGRLQSLISFLSLGLSDGGRM